MFCIFGSVIYAALVNSVYVKFRRSENGVWIYIYLSFLFPWVFLFFQNVFSSLSIYLNVFYAFAIYNFAVLLGRFSTISSSVTKIE